MLRRCIAVLKMRKLPFKDMLAWNVIALCIVLNVLALCSRRRGNVAAAEEWNGWRVGNLRPVIRADPVVCKFYKSGNDR